MGKNHTAEFKQEAVRVALTSGLTTARQAIRSVDERGASRLRLILGLGFQRSATGYSRIGKTLRSHCCKPIWSARLLSFAKKTGFCGRRGIS